MPLTSAAVTVAADGRPVSAGAGLDPGRVGTGNRRRDRDLRGPRFLDAGRRPTITFLVLRLRPPVARQARRDEAARSAGGNRPRPGYDGR